MGIRKGRTFPSLWIHLHQYRLPNWPKSSRQRRIRPVLVAIFLTLFLTTAVEAQSQGGIEGQVLNGTAQASRESLADLPITLAVAAEGESPATFSTTTDEEGRFRFAEVDLREGSFYQVQVEYKGVIYTSEVKTFASGSEPLTFPLTIYETTNDPGSLVIERQHILVEFQVEFQQGNLTVLEFLLVENSQDRTYIGDSGGHTLRLPLPPRATNIQFEDPLMAENATFSEEGLALTQPVLPGETAVLFSYRLPLSGPEFTVTKSVVYPTTNFNFLVEDVGAQVESPTLAFVETVEAEGGKYLHYFAQDLEGGTVVTVWLSQIPAVIAGPETVSGIPLLPSWALLGLVALVMAAVLVWAVRRQPATAALSSKEDLIRAMADLDDAYAAGQVPEEEWRAKRAVMKEELARVWRTRT